MSQEFRRARRRKAPDTIVVTDAMTGEVVGRIANLSETGMLLLADPGLVNDALYQFRFTLPGSRERRDQPLELGAHLLWTDQASPAGQAWTGLRFIGLDDEQARQLRTWVDTPGSQYV